MLYPAQTVKPSLKLRAYAFALNIPRERRDLLLEAADTLVTAFAENSNVELLSRAIVDRSKSAAEARFICHGVGDILRRRFGSPYRARAVIFASLSGHCAELIVNRSAVPAPDSHVLETQNADHPKVLLIFGDSDMRELLAETIRAFPSEVTLVADGFAALKEMNRTNFDLIVSEFFLPILDGDALYAESEPHCRRFIFLTGKSMLSHPLITAFRLKTSVPFLTLPCSSKTLTATIAASLSGQLSAHEEHADEGESGSGLGTDPGTISDQLCHSVAAKVIVDLQAMTDLVFGDESGLTNLWEEICVQRQGEVSEVWYIYEETVRVLIEAHLADLCDRDLKTIWLETDHGIVWESQDGQEPPISADDIAEYVAGRYVYSQADKSSNDRIAAFLSSQQ